MASSSALILDLDEYSDTHSWDEIADKGFIRNHDSEGDTLYGIEVMVDPGYRDMKFGRRLYEARKDLAVKKKSQANSDWRQVAQLPQVCR